MSTDLYRVRVLALDPARRQVDLRVFLVYYDWSGVPTDPSFFFRVLWDESDTHGGGGGPLGDAVSVKEICDEEFVDANTQVYVERVIKLSRKNDPLPPGESPPTFVYSRFTDEEVLTQGDYEVIVTDPRWIAHLSVGQTWQTTAYETRARMPPGRETLLLDEVPSPAKQAMLRKAADRAAKQATARKPRR